ncbi:Flp pilus assembly protein CpaB [Indiicoccus explosivorum]|uniref:Flp pilus assembly protein CpaB n=1 Tax=Indiicoccus explosivorum TaxID=1917864 RepID=UPI000B4421FF|nr:Flp pilus assembly protein CpaB [Indiicoccus explosivorum]
MKPKKILLLAIVSGLVTTFVFYLFIGQQQPAAVAEQPAMVSVVTAAADLQESEEITAESLTIKEVPEGQVHADAIRDEAEIVGKYTAAPIKAGEVILLHRIQQEGEVKVASKKIAEGYRAVSINVDFVKSVSNLIEPEDMVDVVLTKTVELPEGPEILTELMLENVKVLAVGKRFTEAKEGEPPAEYMAVTLELTPEDAVELVDASSRGSLQLLLRSQLISEGTPEEPAEEVLSESTDKELTEAVETASDEERNVPAPAVISIPERSLIRNGPSLEADVLGVVEAGALLTDLHEEEMDEDGRLWFRVETKDQLQGWISSRIVKYENE